tara:strand:+ start:1263 stop:2036 length:774 start_codon:yes stop_codon:yes gene_type:complete
MIEHPLIKHIKREINKNRNFVGILVGRVGTGKSYSALKLCYEVDPTFTEERVLFKIEDLLEMVHENKIKPGQCILFDEAGISASNRESYMNKFNKAMSYLLQTWRHRNIVLFVTCPSIAFIDKGIRSMFDLMIETQKVVKSRRVVQASAKIIQHNYQMGKTYYHNLKSFGGEIMKLEISKPPLKLINRYEKTKTIFTTELYKHQMEELRDTPETKEIDEIRKCKLCGNVGDYKRTKERWECRKCPNIWKHSLPLQSV